MKCPKCDYLGFETGDRCRNCGYDFSLLAAPDSSVGPDLPLHLPQDLTAETHPWLDQMAPPGEAVSPPLPAATVAAPRRADPPLPLFHPASPYDDEPLIKLPAAPRPPLAVRRTPEAPRPRTVPRPPHRHDPEPVLVFLDDQDAAASSVEPASKPRHREAAREASGAGRRLLAAAIDHGLLFAIDVIVVYFTLRIAALTMTDWRQLPAAPMLVFLGLVKVAYFCAFTMVGGQTVGKMAARIQVVTDDDTVLDPPRAVRRTLAGVVSLLTLGLGFLPILVGNDRRALHDRMAHTRVVALPSA
jgi:uncharacterized RDD family membrane protein YckC